MFWKVDPAQGNWPLLVLETLQGLLLFPTGRKHTFKEEPWQALKLSWHDIGFLHFLSYGTLCRSHQKPPCLSWNRQNRLLAGRWPAPGSGKAVGLLLTWVDGRIIAPGGQGGPLPALPLLLHLFFQYQLAQARVELFTEKRKMKAKPAITFRELQFLFRRSCKKFLTLERAEAYCPRAWWLPKRSARFWTLNPP